MGGKIKAPKLHTLYWLRANRLLVEIIQKEIVRPQNLFDRTFIALKVVDANRNSLCRIIHPQLTRKRQNLIGFQRVNATLNSDDGNQVWVRSNSEDLGLV